MTMEEKYKESYWKFKELIHAGFSISMATNGIQVETPDLEVGSRIFVKLVSHARAIFMLLPKAPAGDVVPEQELWDISSIAVLARSLVDAYYALYYVAVDDPGKKVKEFRWLNWDYHAEKRKRKKLELIGSQHPDIPSIEEHVHSLKEQIINHDEYQKLNGKAKKKIRNANEARLLTNSEISELANIDKDYYKNVFMFLSSYVHSYPFSIQQLIRFQAGEEESMRLMNIVIQYSSIYLSLSIRDYITVIPIEIEIDQKIQQIIELWSGIASDFSNFKMA
jgi:hypothetical protein